MKKKNSPKLDLLAFAPHPDDAELGCGGLLALLASQGYKVGIADLSRGELGSAGTVETRAKEAAQASKILGLSFRKNLGLPDGHINPFSAEQEREVVRVLREQRPQMICIPLNDGRHPDHESTELLLNRAVFLAGLKKYSLESLLPHTTPTIISYPTRKEIVPSFVVDISKVFKDKIRAVKAFGSQIKSPKKNSRGSSPVPLIQSALTLPFVEARAKYFGAMIGKEFGEGFLSRSAISISNPIEFFEKNPTIGAIAFQPSGDR